MSVKFHRARKNHWCDSCKRRIPFGAMYWRDFHPGDDDTEYRDVKEHSDCKLFTHQPLKED